jgi:hypothetical protein
MKSERYQMEANNFVGHKGGVEKEDFLKNYQ